MRAIDHHLFLSFGFPKLLLCPLDTLCIVICAGLTTTKDDEAVLVPGCANNCHDSWLGDGQEVVSALSAVLILSVPSIYFPGKGVKYLRSNRINSNIQASISAILKPNRETQPTG